MRLCSHVSGTPNFVKAAKFYRQAADARNAQAAFNLGYMHEHGIGLPKDEHIAKRMYDLVSTQTARTPYSPIKPCAVRGVCVTVPYVF